jgi:lipopolysaccharide transport system permease protein
MNAALAIRRHGPLFRNMVRREVRQRYKGSALGLIWTLIAPAIAVSAYSLVFRYLFKIDIEYYALFLFVGLTAWTFFMGGAQSAASSLVGNANLVKKVRFPREIVPLSTMTANAFTTGAMLAVALPFCLILTEGSRLPVLALPGLVVVLAAFTAGVGLIVAALNVYFRDVEHILSAISLPWYFITPVMYSFATLPLLTSDGPTWVIDWLHWANPIAPFMIAIQDSLFWGRWPTVGDVIYSVVAAAIILPLGILVFRRLEREMAVEL